VGLLHRLFPLSEAGWPLRSVSVTRAASWR
jgi:hypothetical protein